MLGGACRSGTFSTGETQHDTRIAAVTKTGDVRNCSVDPESTLWHAAVAALPHCGAPSVAGLSACGKPDCGILAS